MNSIQDECGLNIFHRLSISFVRLFSLSVTRNWSLLTLSGLLSQVLSMLATVRIARVLEPEGFGQVNVIQAISAIGVVLAGLGARQVVIRECARDHDRSQGIFYSTALLQGLALIPTWILILLYIKYGNQILSYVLVATAVGILMGQLMWDLIESVAFAYERMEYTAYINISGSVIWVWLAWTVSYSWLTPFSVCLAFALLQGIKTIIYFVIVKQAGFLKGKMNLIQCIHMIQQFIPFYWLALVGTVSIQLPILFLADRSGHSAVGLFNVGYKLLMPIQMLSNTLMTSLYPGLSQNGIKDGEHFMLVIRQVLLGIIIIGTAMATFISLFRSEIILIFFGNKYTPSADVIAFLCWHTIFLAIFHLIGISLAARDKQNWLAALSTCSALVSAPILWVGSGHGAVGLAIALLSTSALNIIYHLVIFNRSLPYRLPLFFFLKLFAAFAGGMIITFCTSQSLFWFIRGAVCFLVAILLIKYAISLDFNKYLVNTEIKGMKKRIQFNKTKML